MTKRKSGWLTPSDFGEAMPVTHPLYPRGPWHYRDCRGLAFVYHTDDEAALSRMPAELELFEPATAVLFVAEYGFTTVSGTYSDCSLGFLCRYRDQLMLYQAHLFETAENGQIVGREVWGFPKKLCEKIEFTSLGAGDVRATVDLFEGHRLLTATVRPSENEPLESHHNLPLVVLKVIPDAEGGKQPALAQLVAAPFDIAPIVGSDGRPEIFSGPGQIHFDQPSEIAVPVRELVSCTYLRFHAHLPYGEILKTY